jgi:hypothetical protein
LEPRIASRTKFVQTLAKVLEILTILA